MHAQVAVFKRGDVHIVAHRTVSRVWKKKNGGTQPRGAAVPGQACVLAVTKAGPNQNRLGNFEGVRSVAFPEEPADRGECAEGGEEPCRGSAATAGFGGW
jgi:hypothetical protein